MTAKVSYLYHCVSCGTRHRYAHPGWRSAVYCTGRTNGDFHVAERPAAIALLAGLAWLHAQGTSTYRLLRHWGRLARHEYAATFGAAQDVLGLEEAADLLAPCTVPLFLALFVYGLRRMPLLDTVDVHAWGVGITRVEAWRARTGATCRKVVAATVGWIQSMCRRHALIGLMFALAIAMRLYGTHAPPVMGLALVVAASGNGNWLTAGTWGAIDATSFLNSETGTTTLTTAYVVSSTFTPGAITIDGIGLKVSNRTGTTGTMSVHLEIATVEVPGTLVTINVADLPAITTADVNGGWSFFKFAAPVLLVGATVYGVAAKTSSASQVDLYRDGTAANYSRYLRTTTTGAPAAGNDAIVTGAYTGAGASATVTVTMDETSTVTDYGSATNSTVSPSLAISQGGTLTYAATAASNFYLRQSGNVIVSINGTLSLGTVGTPCPRNSTMKLGIDCDSNIEFGLLIRNGGTFNAQGQSRTSGKTAMACKLNGDAAANATTLNVDTNTGWLSGDSIGVASTANDRTLCESGTLNGAAGATSLTVNGFAGAGGGVANAHSGTSPTQAEVVLLTRAVSVLGHNASFPFIYIYFRETATVAINWAAIVSVGFNAANKLGAYCFTTTGSASITNAVILNSNASSSVNVLTFSGASFNNVTFSTSVIWAYAGIALNIAQTSGTTWTVSGNYFMFANGGAAATQVQVGDYGGTFTNNTFVGSRGAGLLFFTAEVVTGTISGNLSHSHDGTGLQISAMGGGALSTVSTTTVWRNGGVGITLAGPMYNTTMNTVTAFGNGTSNVGVTGNLAMCDLLSFTLAGDTTYATTNGIAFSATSSVVAGVRLMSASLGAVTGIYVAHTNDINCSAVNYVDLVMWNCLLASATEVANQTNLVVGSRIASQKHDQTAGLHKTWKREGTLAIETGTVHTGSQALSLTPNASATASTKLESSCFQAAVASGATVTPTVFLNKSAAYNGSQPRLIVKKNVALGIAADTVLATYASGTGSWNAISGATPAVTDDGVLDFTIDCDFGTGGVVYVDSLSVN